MFLAEDWLMGYKKLKKLKKLESLFSTNLF